MNGPAIILVVWKGIQKARNANQRPMATVAAVPVPKNAVAAMSMLVNPNPRERSPHYLQTSVGDAEKQDTRKARSARHLSQSAGIVESRDTMRR